MNNLIKAADDAIIALAEAGDVIQCCHVNTGIDLGAASDMPFYDDTMRKIDNALTAYRAARNEQGEVKVKQLVWEHHPAGAIAATPTGFAYILDTRGKHRVTSIKGFNPRREFDDLEAAKAAAQADHETRIRSALEE